MGDEPEQGSNEAAVTETQFIEIFKYLMRLFADAHDLDTKAMRSVKVKDFVEWCVANEHPISTADMEAIMPQLNVPAGVLEFIWGVFQNPYDACQVLLPIWPSLVLSGQPPCLHQPKALLFAFTALFADNTVLQMQAQTPWDPKKKLTDGFLCSLLLAQSNNMINMLGHVGLDQLWKQYGQPLPERLQKGVKSLAVLEEAPKPEPPNGQS
jgi:hypothetical protein